MIKKISWQLKIYKNIYKLAFCFAGVLIFILIINFTQTAKMIPAGSLTVSLDSSSPIKQLLLENEEQKTVAVFKVQAGAFEDLDLDEVTLTDLGSGTVGEMVYLYSSSRSDGGSVNDPIAQGVYLATTSLLIPDNTVIIPVGGSVLLTVKVDVEDIDLSPANNGDILRFAINASSDIKATGKTSLLVISDHVSSFPLSAAGHVVYQSFPFVSISSVPSGLSVPSINTLIAQIGINRIGTDNITFNSIDGNSLTIWLSTNCSQVGTWHNSLTLKDTSGMVLDTISNINLCQSGYYTFDFSDNDFTAPSFGLRIYADTTQMGGIDSPIQVSLKDDAPANINWSINSDGGNYQEADVIFRNDLNSGMQVITGSSTTIQPVFAVNAASPSGIYTPGVKTPLAIFNIAADGDDISFDGPAGAGPNAGNSLTVQISSACDGPGSLGNLILEDKNHTQLDSISANLCVPGPYTFDFSDADLVVAQNNNDQIYIYGDTTSGNVSGVYVWLNADSNDNIDWSIAFDGGNYQVANKIFSPPIWANVLLDGDPIMLDSVNPTVTIYAPTKTSTGPITHNYVVVRDNWSVSPSGVDFTASTANVITTGCSSVGINLLTCVFIDVVSSGDLIVDVTDDLGNTTRAIESGFVINYPSSGSGARQEILSQPVANCQVVINNSQATTNNLTVDLQVTADQTVSEMYLTNRDDFTGGSWQQFATQTIWTLAEGEGTKTVYVHVRDGMGRISPLCTDTIEYATSLPVEPTPEESPIPEPAASNNIVKLATHSTVYFIDSSNQRHPFPDANVYHSWFADFSPLTIVSQATLETMPMSDNMTIRPGTWLVKIVTDPKVYAVEPGGILRWVETEVVAVSLYGLDWATKVIDVPDALFMDYQIGDAISNITHATGSVIQYQNETEVYYIDNGQKRLISPAIFANNYFQDKFIVNNTSPLIVYSAGLAWSDLSLVQLLESQ